jgi:SAM-dependent methyltransferase
MRTGSILDELQYRILRAVCPDDPHVMEVATAYEGRSKLRILLGDDLVGELRGGVVADFGCGEGTEAIEMAQSGAARVVGIDTWESALETARRRAREGAVENVSFVTHLSEPVDAVVCLDGFEHFGEPEKILRLMYDMLSPGGLLALSFGPPWYHPLGGHSFSFFPWAHLVFSESALCRWRTHFRCDGATRFAEVEGGLNRMSIRRFRRIVEASPFTMERLECLPIRRLARLHNGLTREFTTATVRCRMRKSASAGRA